MKFPKFLLALLMSLGAISAHAIGFDYALSVGGGLQNSLEKEGFFDQFAINALTHFMYDAGVEPPFPLQPKDVIHLKSKSSNWNVGGFLGFGVIFRETTPLSMGVGLEASLLYQSFLRYDDSVKFATYDKASGERTEYKG